MNAANITGTLHDDCTGGKLPVEAELDSSGLWVRLPGYGVAESHDGDGWVVRVEFWNGRPQVVIWNDIATSDPMIVDLSNAAESRRPTSAE